MPSSGAGGADIEDSEATGGAAPTTRFLDVDSLQLPDVHDEPDIDPGLLEKLTDAEAEDLQAVAARLAAAVAERRGLRGAAQSDLNVRLRELGLKQ